MSARFPTFSGTPSEDIEVFLFEFDAACDAYDLPDPLADQHLLDASDDGSTFSGAGDDTQNLRYKLLRKSLNKEATRFLLGCGPSVFSSYSALRTALVDHFQPEENRATFKVSLRHRRRKPNESLLKLATDIKLLTKSD